MKHVRVILFAVLFVVGVVIVLQNQQDFTQSVQIRLNLYFFEKTSMPIPIYVVFILSFLVGVLLAASQGLIERFRLKKSVRHERKENERLRKELESLKGEVPAQAPSAEPLVSSAPSGEENSGSFPALQVDTQGRKD